MFKCEKEFYEIKMFTLIIYNNIKKTTKNLYNLNVLFWIELLACYALLKLPSGVQWFLLVSQAWKTPGYVFIKEVWFLFQTIVRKI